MIFRGLGKELAALASITPSQQGDFLREQATRDDFVRTLMPDPELYAAEAFLPEDPANLAAFGLR